VLAEFVVSSGGQHGITVEVTTRREAAESGRLRELATDSEIHVTIGSSTLERC
jgi:hypothetical protein